MKLTLNEINMRLPILIYLAFTLAVSFSGCKRTSQTDSAGGHPELVFRLASEMNSNTKLWEASNLFKRELEKASPEHRIKKGEIKVEFYDQGAIGTERQLLEACFFGVVEVVQINTSVVTTVESSYSVLNLPYLFVNGNHLKSILYGEVGQKMLNKLRDHRLQGLAFYSGGFRNMFYRAEQCADTPEELAGLKIRVMESPIMINAINAIGPSATPIPFSELYQSIRTGVVDGAENSVNIFISYKYYETGINCFTFTEHSTDQHILVANAKWLDSLEPKYQKRILQVAKQIVPEFNLIWEKAIQNATAQMKEQGVTVNAVKNKNVFIERVDKIAEQFVNNHSAFSRELYRQIKEEGKNFLTE